MCKLFKVALEINSLKKYVYIFWYNVYTDYELSQIIWIGTFQQLAKAGACESTMPFGRGAYFNGSVRSRLHGWLATEHVGPCCTCMPLQLLPTAIARLWQVQYSLTSDVVKMFVHAFMIGLDFYFKSTDWCKRRCIEEIALCQKWRCSFNRQHLEISPGIVWQHNKA